MCRATADGPAGTEGAIMAGTLTATEEAQLRTTIGMFEVIVQSDPNDCQSLEILKEAYSKLRQTPEMVSCSKRLAKAYETSGQLSSAILELESLLEWSPDDPEVKAALSALVTRADTFADRPAVPETDFATKPRGEAAKAEPAVAQKAAEAEIDDGRDMMRKVFVEGKYITSTDFDQHWVTPDLNSKPTKVQDPFIQTLADKAILPVDQSLALLCERSRLCYLPLEKYELDMEVARQANRDACLRWCVLPFDRMSKTILVATSNPFNRQAALDLMGPNHLRFHWYLSSPVDLVKLITKVLH
jgi:hypothetical protein